MIVKNEETTLPRCLESVREIVDEIVVVDTGSEDNTTKIAESYGARIFHFDWVNDFSAARNYALKNSSGEFILYLDADEILSPNSKTEIKKLITNKDNVGYLCTITSIDEKTYQSNSIQYVRFFKNSNNIQFTGKAHEQITDSLINNGYKIIKSNIEIIHYGYNISKEEKKKKAQRNLQLLLSDLIKSPTAYNYFQIGQSYFILENYKEAESYFDKAITLKGLSNSLLAECYSYLAQIYHFDYNIEESEKNILKAISINNKQPYYYLLLSKIQQRKSDFAGALSSLLNSYKLNISLDRLKKENLQTVHLNNYELLLQIIELSLKINDAKNLSVYTNELVEYLNKSNPNNVNSYKYFFNKLIKKSIEKTDLEIILDISDEHNLNIILHAVDFVSDIDFKLELLDKLQNLFPQKFELLKKMSLVYDNMNKTEVAIKMLESNLELIQDDPSSLLYLASFHIKCNNHQRALGLFDMIEDKFPHIQTLTNKVKEIREKISRFVEK
jgi:glycosyltransferase involved in cell wall biosynthesis